MADINYLGSIPLGKVNGWDQKKASTITPITFPGQNAGKTEGIDTLGIIAYFNLRGRMVGSFNLLQGYLGAISDICDGNQTSSNTIRSPFVNARNANNAIRRGVISTTTSGASATNVVYDSTAHFQSTGIQSGDYVKNLITGLIAEVDTVDDETHLTLKSLGGLTPNIFLITGGEPYAATTNIEVKVLSIDWKWDLPGLSYCDYEMSIMQVKDNQP